ncbi:MAG: hypothetical protein WBA02_09525 [Jannaschia helgolandensis]|jgi:hypothetical protein|uniref:Methyltransferase domain-containing protein n=1 Tax=Jannaschia helgolandensis TaxID=188906 RepID=A0A1H7L1T1_9RHOB|nr:hypothetical protein [Jannaschia helgolandensis]SEK93023.1 hypothetical protein SAMN04488526_1581 [Jannaschia helgolandensis]
MTETAENKGFYVPELTFPPEEQALVREMYSGAQTVLEYGTGGSTVLALDVGVPHLIAVESDKDWLDNIQRIVDDRKPKSKVDLYHADIGPTKKWGTPDGNDYWMKYPRYPLQVWEQPFFEHPDVVLIDGRFRVGCFLTVLARATKPVTVLFDDYTGRSTYSRAGQFMPPSQTVGRIGVWELDGTWKLDGKDLTIFVDTFFKIR